MLFMYNRSKKESHKTEFVFSCSSLTQSHWIKIAKWFPSVISFKVWYCCYCNFLLWADKEFCLTSVLNVVTSVDGTRYVILSFFKSSIRKKFRCSTKQNTSKICYWLSKEIFPVFRVHRRLGFALPSLYFIIRHISFLSIKSKYHILIGLNKACDWRLYFYVRLLIIYSRHYDCQSTY